MQPLNYHEFWAVAVETFFENPVGFKHQLPDLYAAIARLLNQDTLNFVSGKTTIIIKDRIPALADKRSRVKR